MGRVFVNSIPRTVLTVKQMNNAIIDNQQLHLVLAMVCEIVEKIFLFVDLFLARTNVRSID